MISTLLNSFAHSNQSSTVTVLFLYQFFNKYMKRRNRFDLLNILPNAQNLLLSFILFTLHLHLIHKSNKMIFSNQLFYNRGDTPKNTLLKPIFVKWKFWKRYHIHYSFSSPFPIYQLTVFTQLDVLLITDNVSLQFSINLHSMSLFIK